MFRTIRKCAVATGCGIVAVATVLALSACSTTAPKRQPTQPLPQSMNLGLKLSPAALGETISLQQHLTVERDGRIDELDTALEVDRDRLALVGLALGKRVLTLQYDGRNLQQWRHPLLPEQVRGDDVLQDIQLTLWPTDAIRQALPADWRMEENGLRRTLFDRDTPVMLIDYSHHLRWQGKVTLTNLRYHYRIIIQSVSTDE